MKFLWTCRRTYLATLAITVIGGLGAYLEDASVVSSLATIAIGIAASNAYEKTRKPNP